MAVFPWIISELLWQAWYAYHLGFYILLLRLEQKVGAEVHGYFLYIEHFIFKV